MTLATASTLAPASKFDLEQIRAFLFLEARLLDDRQWDEWIKLYSSNASFWMPAWDDDDQLVEDPQQHVSLIYYPNRKAWKIGSSGSRPSAPGPAHRSRGPAVNLPPFLPLPPPSSRMSRSWRSATASSTCAFNWHTLSHRYKDR